MRKGCLHQEVATYPNWQRSQPISYKAKFSPRDNIYLLDHKYNITYQNIRGKLRLDWFLYPKIPKMARKLPNNLGAWAFYRIAKFVLTKKVLPIPYRNLCCKSMVRPKSKSKDLKVYLERDFLFKLIFLSAFYKTLSPAERVLSIWTRQIALFLDVQFIY